MRHAAIRHIVHRGSPSGYWWLATVATIAPPAAPHRHMEEDLLGKLILVGPTGVSVGYSQHIDWGAWGPQGPVLTQKLMWH